MLPDCPNELNFLVPFLQRAYEMAESQPVMAYYCKFYSIALALKGSSQNKFKRTPQTDAFLAKLFDDLETEKAKLSDHSTIKDLTKGAIYVRELAYRVFLTAEKQESSPSTIKKAPQTYLAAINFLQVYRGVFLEDPSALELGEEEMTDELKQVDEKSKYAKWRIVEIKKQLMVESATASPTVNSNAFDNPYATGSTKDTPITTQSTPVSPVNILPQPQQYQIYQQVQSPNALTYDPKVLSDCEKYARHAISALNFDDVETAAANLRSALKTLQPYLKENK